MMPNISLSYRYVRGAMRRAYPSTVALLSKRQLVVNLPSIKLLLFEAGRINCGIAIRVQEA